MLIEAFHLLSLGFYMKKIALLLALGVSVAGLSACGGGSGEKTTTTTVNESLPNNQAIDTGSASNPFMASANGIGFIVAALGTRTTGIGTKATSFPFTQTADGAFTTLSSFSLTGNPSAVQNISGDASYALGRWSYGTVEQNAVSIGTMNQSTNAFWHYIAFNFLTTLPTSGTYTCNSGTFTEPSFTGSQTTAEVSPLFLGSSTGVASLAFGSAGANISVTITTTVGSSGGASAINTTINSARSFTTISSPSMAVVALGDAGNGAIRIVGLYNTTVGTAGNKYQGIFQFSCQP